MCARHWAAALACVLVAGSATSIATADWIKLHGGGEIRGKIVDDSDETPEESILVESLNGTRIAVQREAVKSIVRQSLEKEEHAVRAAASPDTVDGHFEMAQWCLKQRLTAERVTHLERVIELDPEHEAAHLKLGHVREGGEWTSRDELMKARGFVNYKGRYVTEAQYAELTKTTAQRDSEGAWRRKIRLWHGWLENPKSGRQAEALNNLRAVDHPDAIPALTHYFAQHADVELRQIYVEVLGAIGGRRPVEPLVWQSMVDPRQSIRTAAVAGISPEHSDYAAIGYRNGLQHSHHRVVRRAATALRTLGSSADVPELIEALVTEHTYPELLTETAPDVISLTQSVCSRSPAPLPPVTQALVRAGRARGIYATEPDSSPRTRTGLVARTHSFKNEAVRDALRQLTGEDFGFDSGKWTDWWESRQAAGGSVSSPRIDRRS